MIADRIAVKICAKLSLHGFVESAVPYIELVVTYIDARHLDDEGKGRDTKVQDLGPQTTTALVASIFMVQCVWPIQFNGEITQV